MIIDYVANVRMPTEKAHGLQIMKMCEAWARLGHDVTLVVPKRINHITKPPSEYYSVEKNFSIRKVFTIDLLPLQKVLGTAAFWAENLSFAASASIVTAVGRSDIIFSRDFWTACFLTLIGKKVVYELHDSPNRHWITRRAFQNIWKFVSTNRFKADELVSIFGVARERILVAPNGVDLDFFQIPESTSDCRAMLDMPQEGIIVLYTGHLYSWKGALTLLEAARVLPKHIRVVFVGGTAADIARFRVMAQGCENVTITEHQEYKKIPYFLRAADILVLPNTGKEEISLHETSPLKLFEYMTSGKPVIASDIPSVREVVDERHVIFFRADDAQNLRQTIEHVAGKYETFLPRADAAQQTARWYSWQARAERILGFIAS